VASIHLGAKILAEDPNVDGERRVIFLSSDDQGAANKVAKLVERLGFAPVWLGDLQRVVYSFMREGTPGVH
jgi:predicted dinucleotide-binding enzyme